MGICRWDSVPHSPLNRQARRAPLTLPVFGAMIGQILHGRNGMAAPLALWRTQQRKHDNGTVRSQL